VLSISWELLTGEDFVDLADWYDVMVDGDRHAVIIINKKERS